GAGARPPAPPLPNARVTPRRRAGRPAHSSPTGNGPLHPPHPPEFLVKRLGLIRLFLEEARVAEALSTLSPPPAAPAAEPDLAARAHADGVRFLMALFVDLAGKPCAKLVPVEGAEERQNDGVGFAGYAVGAIGQQPSDPDLIAIPDLASYTPLPWVREGLALVHCDPYVEGEPWR